MPLNLVLHFGTKVFCNSAIWIRHSDPSLKKDQRNYSNTLVVLTNGKSGYFPSKSQSCQKSKFQVTTDLVFKLDSFNMITIVVSLSKYKKCTSQTKTDMQSQTSSQISHQLYMR